MDVSCFSVDAYMECQSLCKHEITQEGIDIIKCYFINHPS